MISGRGRFWVAAGLLLLVSLPSAAWAGRPVALDSAVTQAPKGRQAVACATVAADRPRRGRPFSLAVRSCAPPAPPEGGPPVSHEGFRRIDWTLHPEASPPGPTSRRIVVAVHELECTGGRDPIPHLLPPEVRYLRGAVVITLWIEVLKGPHTCPGNPVGRLAVKLPGSLGSRQLYDGSSNPPRRVEPGEDPRRLPSR